MLAALLIVFREVIEAGLVIGIVLAATKAVAGRGRWVASGTCVGIIGACLVALLTSQIAAAFSGAGQEIFNATILASAVVMLAFHNMWMARHGRALSTQFQALGAAVQDGHRTLLALAVVVGLAVLREGVEIVLFLYGVTVSATANATPTLIGGGVGLILGGAVATATYFGLLKIPARQLFRVISVMIALLAAGMASSAIGYLEQADIIQIGTAMVWDSSSVLPQSSLLGISLHTLIGYNDQPTAAQLIAYALTLTALLLGSRAVRAQPRPKVATPVDA